MSDQQEVWAAVSQLLRAQLTESVWFSTFTDVTPIIDDDHTRLVIQVPSTLARDRILTRYLPLITDAIEELGFHDRRFDVNISHDNSGHDNFSHDNFSHDNFSHDNFGHDTHPDGRGLGDTDHHGGTLHEHQNSGGLHDETRDDLRDAARTDVREETSDRTTGYFSDNRARSVSTSPSRSGESDEVDAIGLNPKYSFETFVKGVSNQFALAAAQRVAETPARSYNPLFIYGAAGLGKTHLLHAIGHYVHRNYQHHVLRYVSTESFMNEYVDAIRSNSMNGLRHRYRDVDVLLIDDVQFLEGKEGLQEEFFHTFNALHGSNKQIVISSDRMPDAIPTLEERLRGRFKWGLITDVQPPDLETRLAILRNKAERERVQVPNETLEFIASKITNNIRELEGALIRVTAYSSLSGRPITTELAQQQLADLLTDTESKPRTDLELLQAIADILGYDVDALQGKSRQRPLVTARQIAMYVFRDQTDLSYPSIARLFGGRDHTTVIHAVEKIMRQMGERQAIYEQVTAVIQKLKVSA